MDLSSNTRRNANTSVTQTSRALLVCAISRTPCDYIVTTLTHAAEQFTQFYYKTFDENRSALGALYV